MTSYSFDEEGVAFYFFIATLTAFYLIPTTLKLLWPKRVSENDKEPTSSAKESLDKQSRIKSILTAKSKTSHSRKIILGALWVVFLWAAISAWQAKINFKPYDPFEILGISTSASDEEIKTTFKKLSRLYHPDKATEGNRAESEKKFLEVSRAYKALTDEVARKNWEEYGNPDGVRTFALGVALPSWLVNSSNRIILLALYCVAFGVGLPLIVKRWWTTSKEFTKDGIRHASMSMFFREMKENCGMKRIVEMLAGAAEFSMDVKIRPTDETALKELVTKLEGYKNPNGENYERPKKNTQLPAVKAHALLYCHFHRIPVDNIGLKTDQEYIVNKAAQLVLGMLQIALARQWLLPAISCMNISQFLVQAVWDRSSPLFQLPFISPEIIRHSTMGKRPIKNIADLLDMSEGERRSFLKNLNDEEYQELLNVAQTFPIVRVNAVTFRILGQEHITPGGLITCQVMLNLEYPSIDSKDAISDSEGEGKTKVIEEDVQTFEFDEDGNLIDDPTKKRFGVDTTPRPIYSPYFPAIKRPYWWVGLSNRNNTNLITQPIKVTDLIDRKTVTLQLPAPPRPMNVTIRLFIKSDSLLGADIEKEVSFTVHPPSESFPVSENWEISGDEDDQAVPFGGSEEDDDEE